MRKERKVACVRFPIGADALGGAAVKSESDDLRVQGRAGPIARSPDGRGLEPLYSTGWPISRISSFMSSQHSRFIAGLRSRYAG